MSAIEKALLETTGQKPQKKGEDRQKYLLRLAVHANDKLSDEEWDALERTAGATEWAVAAVKADNSKKTVPDFPDLEDAADEADEEADATEEAEDEGDEDDAGEEDADDEPEEGEEEEVTEAKTNGKAKPGGKKAPAKKPAAKKAPAPKVAAKGKDKPASKAVKSGGKKAAPAKGGKKPVSARRAVKLMIIKKPSLSVDDIMDQLKTKGYDPLSKLTVNTTRSETRDTIKLLNELGHTEIAL